MLSYCGIDCEGCPVHIATLESDEHKQARLRASIARLSGELYGVELSVANIDDCCGCTAAKGKISSACTDCDVRQCAQSKNLVNCGYCEEFPCKSLDRVFNADSTARQKLEEFRMKI